MASTKLPQITKELIETLQTQLAESKQALNSNITKLTIIVHGFHKGDPIHKIFSFPPGQVPPEIYTLFESYANRMVGDLMKLQSEIPLLLVSNKIVAIEDFIKEYTVGEIPSLDPESVAIVKSLVVGQGWTIHLNNTPQYVQRIY